ncbi:Lipase GDSL [Macrophomina phaseolina MS6]|uniref:Lipase GDSL n=1 Tax=Macrophomina phaseolina (strain MS6) TaxID=1126212 RepID=K2RBI3_MACPH|nr:Lipase GDSL [Macrophomina phaseolina MS6]
MVTSHLLSPLLALLVGTASAIPAPQEFPPPPLPGDGSWGLEKFTSLVAFGDSYTDESRLAYFIATGGQAPPVGWIGPESNSTSTGGRIWPRYVADYTGANLYDYAVSGAVCSNKQVNRYLASINGPFPDVEGYEIPAFLADKAYAANGTSVLNIPDTETVYSMWIGTNDLGGNAFLTESQAPGLTIVDYIDCVYNQFDTLYENGARYFVLMNLAPLQLAPVYATPERGGVGQYLNATETSYRMKEQVNLANNVYKYQTPYELLIAKRYPDAHFAIFDMYSLLTDIYINPAEYLNGTAPLNVTSYINTSDSTLSLTDRDSYMWYDALHPSEQTDRVIAANFVEVVRGTSKWATYW